MQVKDKAAFGVCCGLMIGGVKAFSVRAAQHIIGRGGRPHGSPVRTNSESCRRQNCIQLQEDIVGGHVGFNKVKTTLIVCRAYFRFL